MARNRAQTNASSSPAVDKHPAVPEVPTAAPEAVDPASEHATSDSESSSTPALKEDAQATAPDAADPVSGHADSDPEPLSAPALPKDEQNALGEDAQAGLESKGDAGTDPAAPLLNATESATALYEVLTPFKFRGHPIKPPVWIELTAAEAKGYQEAHVLGTEPGEVPSVEVSQDD